MKSIAECLAALTREQLDDAAIRLTLPLQPGMRKADLAAQLAQSLPENMLVVLTSLHAYGLDALESHLDESPIRDATVRVNPDLMDALCMLRGFGLAWHGRVGWEVQPQVWSAIRALTPPERETIVSLSLADDLMAGMLNLYGMLDIAVVQDMLEHLCRDDVPPDLAVYLARIFDANRNVYVADGARICLCSQQLDNPVWLQQQLNVRERLPHAAFNGQQMLDASCGLPGDGAIYAPVKAWLARHGMADDDAFDLLYDAVYNLLNGSEEFVSMLLEEAGVAEAALTPLEQRMFDKLLRAIPQWTLLGHSIEEADRLSGRIPDLPHVGRNDLCPCGSGRRYKHCCGRFH